MVLRDWSRRTQHSCCRVKKTPPNRPAVHGNRRRTPHARCTGRKLPGSVHVPAIPQDEGAGARFHRGQPTVVDREGVERHFRNVSAQRDHTQPDAGKPGNRDKPVQLQSHAEGGQERPSDRLFREKEGEGLGRVAQNALPFQLLRHGPGLISGNVGDTGPHILRRGQQASNRREEKVPELDRRGFEPRQFILLLVQPPTTGRPVILPFRIGRTSQREEFRRLTVFSSKRVQYQFDVDEAGVSLPFSMLLILVWDMAQRRPSQV